MPWFVEKRGDKHCVVKGTKENPGETVTCHTGKDSDKKANNHMRALYANVKDAHTKES